MSTLNSSLSRAKYVVWLWLFGISSFRIKGVFVLLRFDRYSSGSSSSSSSTTTYNL